MILRKSGHNEDLNVTRHIACKLFSKTLLPRKILLGSFGRRVYLCAVDNKGHVQIPKQSEIKSDCTLAEKLA